MEGGEPASLDPSLGAPEVPPTPEQAWDGIVCPARDATYLLTVWDAGPRLAAQKRAEELSAFLRTANECLALAALEARDTAEQAEAARAELSQTVSARVLDDLADAGRRARQHLRGHLRPGARLRSRAAGHRSQSRRCRGDGLRSGPSERGGSRASRGCANSTVLGEAIAGLGHEVDVVSRGEEAVRAAVQSVPDFVLVDIGLPDIDGYEVVRPAKASLPEGARTRFIAVTGYGLPEDRRRSARPGSARTS